MFYTDDLHTGHAWKVTHHYDPRRVWDIYDAPDQSINLEDLGAKFELVVDLPSVDSISYRRSEATSQVVIDDNVVSLVKTDDELADDRETDDMVADYLSSEDSEHNSNDSHDDTRIDNNTVETCDTSDDD